MSSTKHLRWRDACDRTLKASKSDQHTRIRDNAFEMFAVCQAGHPGFSSYGHDDSHHIKLWMSVQYIHSTVVVDECLLPQFRAGSSGYRNIAKSRESRVQPHSISFPGVLNSYILFCTGAPPGKPKAVLESPHNCQRRSLEHRHPDVFAVLQAAVLLSIYLFSAI
jgi:hypothetical protein